MKRDNDLLRKLLFRLEESKEYANLEFVKVLSTDAKAREEQYHIMLLADAGLVTYLDPSEDVVRLTNTGHDFLEAIRQDTVWNNTKSIAEKAGFKTLDAFFGIAVSLAKEKLKKITGFEL